MRGGIHLRIWVRKSVTTCTRHATHEQLRIMDSAHGWSVHGWSMVAGHTSPAARLMDKRQPASGSIPSRHLLNGDAVRRLADGLHGAKGTLVLAEQPQFEVLQVCIACGGAWVGAWVGAWGGGAWGTQVELSVEGGHPGAGFRAGSSTSSRRSNPTQPAAR
jgi:hypothetical protein